MRRLHTFEEKQKISESLKKIYTEGKRKQIISLESRQKISDTLKRKFKNQEIKHWNKGNKGYVNAGSFKKGHTINLGKKMDPVGVQKAVNSKRLNGFYKKNSLKLSQLYSNKTYEEIHGPEKAMEMKLKIGLKSLGRIPSNKNKKYEDFFGEEKAKKIKEQIRLARSKQIMPMKDTKIELKIQQFLTDSRIEFYHHYYVSEITHAYQCDIFIPIQNKINQKTIIECDGDWWHGNPKKYSNPNQMQKEQITEDETRTQELLNQGFRVIRLWESDIKELSLEKFKEILL